MGKFGRAARNFATAATLGLGALVTNTNYAHAQESAGQDSTATAQINKQQGRRNVIYADSANSTTGNGIYLTTYIHNSDLLPGSIIDLQERYGIHSDCGGDIKYSVVGARQHIKSSISKLKENQNPTPKERSNIRYLETLAEIMQENDEASIANLQVALDDGIINVLGDGLYLSGEGWEEYTIKPNVYVVVAKSGSEKGCLPEAQPIILDVTTPGSGTSVLARVSAKMTEEQILSGQEPPTDTLKGDLEGKVLGGQGVLLPRQEKADSLISTETAYVVEQAGADTNVTPLTQVPPIQREEYPVAPEPTTYDPKISFTTSNMRITTDTLQLLVPLETLTPEQIKYFTENMDAFVKGRSDRIVKLGPGYYAANEIPVANVEVSEEHPSKEPVAPQLETPRRAERRTPRRNTLKPRDGLTLTLDGILATDKTSGGFRAGIGYGPVSLLFGYGRTEDTRTNSLTVPLSAGRRGIGLEHELDSKTIGAAVEAHLGPLFVWAGANYNAFTRNIEESIVSPTNDVLATTTNSVAGSRVSPTAGFGVQTPRFGPFALRGFMGYSKTPAENSKLSVGVGINARLSKRARGNR